MTTNHAEDTFGWGLYFTEEEQAEEFRSDLKELRLVAEHNALDSYEWDTWVAYYLPRTDRFYIAAGSGCSCNSLNDDYKRLEDFDSVATLKEVAESLKRAAENGYGDGWRFSKVSHTLNTVMNWTKEEN